MESMEDVVKRKFDIVVFGASGYTGQYVVEELARTADAEKDVTWAVAGRSMDKLQAVLKTASTVTGKDLSDLTIIIADVKNEKSLTEMCLQAKVILNCVGPYRFYGTPVVKACIENGCHHVDISGEPEWLEQMKLMYDGKAKENNVYILEACGFDSIPSELGVLYTKKQFNGDLNSIESFISINNAGSTNYGTWLSAIHSVANRQELKNIRKQLFENPLPRSKHRLNPRSPPIFHSSEVGKWCLPFLMADKSIVYRSMHYYYSEKKQRPIQFQPYTCLQSFFHVLFMIMIGVVFGIFTRFSFGISLLEKFPRFFSFGMFSDDGPTRKQVLDGSIEMTFIGYGYASQIGDLEKEHEDKPDKKIVTHLTGPDAGYATTPICAVQATYVLLKEKNKLPEHGGVYTPGAAFCETSLLSRLQEHNIKFSVSDQ